MADGTSMAALETAARLLGVSATLCTECSCQFCHAVVRCVV